MLERLIPFDGNTSLLDIIKPNTKRCNAYQTKTSLVGAQREKLHPL